MTKLYDGRHCPKCGKEVDADGIEVTSDLLTAYQNVYCPFCSTLFAEAYTLTGLDEHIDKKVIHYDVKDSPEKDALRYRELKKHLVLEGELPDRSVGLDGWAEINIQQPADYTGEFSPGIPLDPYTRYVDLDHAVDELIKPSQPEPDDDPF